MGLGLVVVKLKPMKRDTMMPVFKGRYIGIGVIRLK